MKKVTNKKDIALEITHKYISSDLTMKDISKLLISSHLPFKVDASTVSNCIYYCIFHELVSNSDEQKIVNKIVQNRIRHCKIPVKSNSFGREKYIKTIADRNEYKDAINTVEIIEEYKKLKLEYNSSNELRISSYISSEDEIYYTPPRSVDKIALDLESYVNVLVDKKIDLNIIDYELNYLKRKAYFIRAFYDKI